MRRLVITHGERTIRHEIRDEPVVLGRDPGCDLFFADQRLSRRHVRFEPTPEGVRLEDLGSRNGCWMGDERVSDVVLKPGDRVLLGTLAVVVEEDPKAPPPRPSGDDTATVVLDASALGAPPAPADEDGTVVLSASAVSAASDEAQEKTPPPDEGPPGDEPTVLLKPSAPPPRPSALPDTKKTRILDAGALSPQPSALPKTSILTPEDRALHPAPPAAPPPAAPEASEPDEVESGLSRGSSLPWSARLLLLNAALALLVYFVLAFPLMRTLGNALREESLRRGRVILDLLAAQNGALVGEGRIRDLTVDAVLREERVKEALLIDLDGKVLAPSSRADEPPLDRLPGIDASLSDIRTFYLGRRANGDYVMVQPLLYQSRRVGVAVLVFEAASASASWAIAVLFLAFLVAMLGVVTTLLFAKRMTLGPIGSLRDDVEAVIKGDAAKVPLGEGFPELSELARSINRLAVRTASSARSAPARPGSSATARAPEPAPLRTPVASPPPAPAAAPVNVSESPRVEGSRPSPPPGATEGARLWVDASFIVERADEAALDLLGTSAEIEGKHVIEAVADQKLLEAILDAINALEGGEVTDVTAELATGPISVRVAREGAGVVVALTRL